MWSSIYYSHGLPEPPRAASPSGTHLANWNKERLQWPSKALTLVSSEPRSRHVCKLVQCPTCGQVPWETSASVSPRCPLSTIQLKIKHFGTNTSGMLLSRLESRGSRTWECDEHCDEDGADWVGDHPSEHLHEDGRDDDANGSKSVCQDMEEHTLKNYNAEWS